MTFSHSQVSSTPLARAGPRIDKKDSFRRKALEPGLKLAITPRYLATENRYKSLLYGFRVAHDTICTLIVKVCEAIMEYSAEVMKCPVTPVEWKAVAEGFSAKWNFRHCVGAIDVPKTEDPCTSTIKAFILSSCCWSCRRASVKPPKLSGCAVWRPAASSSKASLRSVSSNTSLSEPASLAPISTYNICNQHQLKPIRR